MKNQRNAMFKKAIIKINETFTEYNPQLYSYLKNIPIISMGDSFSSISTAIIKNQNNGKGQKTGQTLLMDI